MYFVCSIQYLHSANHSYSTLALLPLTVRLYLIQWDKVLITHEWSQAWPAERQWTVGQRVISVSQTTVWSVQIRLTLTYPIPNCQIQCRIQWRHVMRSRANAHAKFLSVGKLSENFLLVGNYCRPKMQNTKLKTPVLEKYWNCEHPQSLLSAICNCPYHKPVKNIWWLLRDDLKS